jgi:hypothetical protein
MGRRFARHYPEMVVAMLVAQIEQARDACGREVDVPAEADVASTGRKVPFCRYGEGQNRTGDTTIFSRVLYQLSYLADEAARRW